MGALLFHLCSILLFVILIQTVSLYRIDASDDSHSDLSSSSFNEELHSSIQDKNIGYQDDEDSASDDSDEWKTRSKRSISSAIKFQQLPERRNNRPHWNPLVAAYKRCGELILREERESCFKDAVQMLFVHKL